MKALATQKVWTDDQLLDLHRDGRKHEVWHGKVMTMAPAGSEHGDVISRLLAELANFAYQHKHGRVYDGQTGFRLGIDHCFAPDISFVSKERRKLILTSKERLFHGAPDLAVEVLSPTDSITKTEEKFALYLAFGTRLAWMVDLKSKVVRVYLGVNRFETLRSGQYLTGNSVLPGFRFPVSRLFEPPDFD
ncbi:MAG TPA: Uma2 family endonuclease [Verrucomicrobiae bacterium]|nr:Uma2 family endonuclease [Verrucomicrobiae bacterium]